MNYRYPPESKPLPGYTIQRGVGRGAFGEVYYAVSDGGKDVALKLVQNQVEVELRGVRECLNLDHPNLIRLYDVQQNEQGESWVVMEYCEGESLEEAIARHPHGMPIDVALQWLRGLCAGVAFLHERDIVHRDLKPSHVFLEDGVVKIGDYGLAKFVTVSRRSGNTEGIGTVFYAAPEMAEGKYGKELDQYAIGVMFYEMLCGDVPFDGQSVAEVLMKHLTAHPDLARFPSPYREIIGRLLEKKPQHRFGSVEELVAALDAPLSGPFSHGRSCWRGRIASVADRFHVRERAQRLGRAMWQNKGATIGIAILLFIAAGLGIAIGEANRSHSNRRNSYRIVTRHAPDMGRLSEIPIKRKDGSATTVQLGQIASFRPTSIRVVDPRRGTISNYGVTHVFLRDNGRKINITERDVLVGMWNAGYCLVIDVELNLAAANARKVSVENVVCALNDLQFGNRSTRQVEIRNDDGRILVRFPRGSENPKHILAKYLNAECPTGSGSAKIPLRNIADVRIGVGGNRVIR